MKYYLTSYCLVKANVRLRQVNGACSEETRFYLSSAPGDTRRLQQAVRDH